jgi:ATP-dependent DNA ligase
MFHKDGRSLYLDGEFYKHGKALQDISGEVRNIEKNSQVTKNSVAYHIFDCFYPTELVTPFSERINILENFFVHHETEAVNWKNSVLSPEVQTKELIQMVEYKIVESEEILLKQYKDWVKQKYEGLMYRNPKGPYLAHPTKTGTFLRSKMLLKLKMRYSDEFKLIGFTEGTKGRDIGAIMWICQTKDGKTTFNVTPKNTTMKKRYAMFKNMTEKDFAENYENQPMTVEYEDLSNNGVPLRAKAIGLRNYE